MYSNTNTGHRQSGAATGPRRPQASSRSAPGTAKRQTAGQGVPATNPRGQGTARSNDDKSRDTRATITISNRSGKARRLQRGELAGDVRQMPQMRYIRE